MIRLNDILDKVTAYNPKADLDVINKAYVFSAKVHQGQIRRSGEPYLSHPLEVTAILCDLKLDVASIATGLLHDTVEDTYATLDQVRDLFGDEIAELVDGVTKISKISFQTAEEQQAENFRKMLLAMAKDIRVILVKLADRLHNMRTLDYMPAVKQARIAQETLDIYAPLANRLGIAWVKSELEDLSLRYIKPDIYYELVTKVAKTKRERRRYIDEVKGIISDKLTEFGIVADVTGRPKHFFSIYEKMRQQNLDFEQIYDLVAFRCIVGSVKACYEALGIIHALWKPVPGRFKDYIAMPKANGYQSLHTTVIGPYGERVEVQIRTEEMHRVAEEGIAAHWRYKEGKADGLSKADQQFAWLRQLLEYQQEVRDPKEFLDTVKLDLFSDEVYVFTPKGDVKAFPRGATPIDFAFAVHTDVGLHTIGARVSGRLVPLKYELQNGDIVEIITSSQGHPSADWLKLVKTSRARSKIRQWIKVEQRDRSILLGRELLEKEFKKYDADFGKLSKGKEMDAALEALGVPDLEALLATVGYGRISPYQVASKLLPPEVVREPKGQGILAKALRRPSRRVRSAIRIKDIEDVLVRFGKCCNPVPGDPIIGYISRGRGVSVHLTSCPTTLGWDPERRIEVQWDHDLKEARPVRIQVVGTDKKGLLAEESAAISASEATISSAQITTTPDRKAINTFEILVSDLDHLRTVIKALERVKGVIKVERVTA
ncbi:MAG TPA: bifunctional (p)ppGpp synthetase/guanosine-3',5'-bis(diphosphate) 3'-pyrophosphohydrolase [Thermodesulfobacteriota bacterium]